jgi:transcriptional regulator with PAS, ATPase and Fis domain
VIRVKLPGLRERREDIPLLVDHFIEKFNSLQNKQISGVSEEVMALLMEHVYPGNVRELENIIEHAFVLCRGELIETQHLPSNFQEPERKRVRRTGAALTLKELEAIYISDAIRRHHGNRTAAARELGIDPSTLFRKVKALKIELPEGDGRNRKKR